jgi:hypothetical protein
VNVIKTLKQIWNDVKSFLSDNGGKVAAAVVVGTSFLGTSFAVAPLDVTTAGTDIAGYIATAAGAGLAIMGALYGVRVIVRAFKSVR